jgi:spore germination protein
MLIFLSGCLNQKILDDVQLATATGFELGEDGKMLEATAVVPVYKPDLTVVNKTYTTSSELSKVMRDKLDRKSHKPFVSGKIEVALFSRELAEKGIFGVLDTFRRDPSTGAKMFLAVVEGNIKKQLKVQYGETDNGMYLSDLIEHNIESGILPKTNLHLYTKDYREEGKDPILPYLQLGEKEVNILGIALFKGDQFIDYLKGEDNYVFMFLNEKFTSDATLTVQLEEQEAFASVFHIKSNRSFKINNIHKNPKILIKVKTEAIIQEYSGDNLTKSIMRKIEKKMEKDIKRKAESMIIRFQELNIDPLGIGMQVRHRTRHWDKDKWDTLYPTIPVQVDVNVDILEAGVIS